MPRLKRAPAALILSRRLFAALPLCLLLGCGGRTQQPLPSLCEDLPCLHTPVRNRTAQGGWKYDAYPQLESLGAGKTITVAYIKGPARINALHLTQMVPREETARSVVLEIYSDDSNSAAVSVPLGDFFADGTGQAADFSNPFVEKAPDSYNCYLPMPFKRSARVTLRNDSNRNLTNYTFVEWQTVPEWREEFGYFHAAWWRPAFQLTPDTAQKMFRLEGPGHLVGEYWNVNTDEPLFSGMDFVMEGNTEHRVDGEEEPSVNYLGSEDSFTFSWGWRRPFNGHKAGINYLSFRRETNPDKLVMQDKQNRHSRISTYRFRDRDAIHFGKSLELTINWSKEFGSERERSQFLGRVRKRNLTGGGWVDYAITTYWYSADPKGSGLALPPVDERRKAFLHENPPCNSTGPQTKAAPTSARLRGAP